jgi:hypothetical protein
LESKLEVPIGIRKHTRMMYQRDFRETGPVRRVFEAQAHASQEALTLPFVPSRASSQRPFIGPKSNRFRCSIHSQSDHGEIHRLFLLQRVTA